MRLLMQTKNDSKRDFLGKSLARSDIVEHIYRFLTENKLYFVRLYNSNTVVRLNLRHLKKKKQTVLHK